MISRTRMPAVRRRAGQLALAIGVLAGCLLGQTQPGRAQVGSERYSSIVIDARNGREISSVNADEDRHPASLTKMMTLYMVFEALRDRRITLDDLVPISAHAASQVPTKLGLVPGSKLTVEQAILGLITKSANDAAAALGEMLGGEEYAFAQMMTLRAHALGMAHTVFRNASGLPDPDQISTARDLATLGRRLVVDFPAEYRYFSAPSFRFRGRMIMNHDRLLQTYPGADGIKTGFVTASGYNLVTSATRSDVRLVGVVLGARNAVERDNQMTALLDQAYERLDVAPVSVAARPKPGGGQSVAPATPVPPVPPGQAAARPNGTRWAVQVGAFVTEAAARQAAVNAHKWTDAGQVRVEQAGAPGKPAWRAQLIGMSAAEASGACAALARRKLPCMVLKPDSGQVASR